MVKTRILYVMASRTDTGVGRVIRFVSGFPYNHVSVTLDSSFESWYSFARYVQDAPFYSGFIRENAHRFCAGTGDARVRIYAVPASEKHAADLEELLPLANRTDSGLIYNYFEALACCMGFTLSVPQCYTCLSFASELLGLSCRSIQELCETLEPQLIYEGSLVDLLHSQESPDELYFSRLGLVRGTVKSAGQLGTLLMRTVYHGCSRYMRNAFRRTIR